MKEIQSYYYYKVEKALNYLEQHWMHHPDLAEIASHVNSSPFHFQKIFSEWVGISPKRYLHFITVNYAKELLKRQSLSSTAHHLGLSGTGRLHDMFVKLEGMTPGEYKNGGKKLAICYSFSASIFGRLLIATTAKGVCHIAFADDKDTALRELVALFPNAEIKESEEKYHQAVLDFFNADFTSHDVIKLHLKGTPFQLKVWEALLQIPAGEVSCYGDVAQYIGNPKAFRAVGTAIGKNPIAYIIPCHRVIQAGGSFGNYHWGSVRKKAILGWELAKNNEE